jgi:hypothetical protein
MPTIGFREASNGTISVKSFARFPGGIPGFSLNPHENGARAANREKETVAAPPLGLILR